jgi:hypothetical protein
VKSRSYRTTFAPGPAGRLAATSPVATEVVPTSATSSARAPTRPAKSERQTSPSSSQSRQRRPVRQPASASSIAASVERGGSPKVALSR